MCLTLCKYYCIPKISKITLKNKYTYGETSYFYLFVNRFYKITGTLFQVQPVSVIYLQKSGSFDQFFVTWSLSRT